MKRCPDTTEKDRPNVTFHENILDAVRIVWFLRKMTSAKNIFIRSSLISDHIICTYLERSAPLIRVEYQPYRLESIYSSNEINKSVAAKNYFTKEKQCFDTSRVLKPQPTVSEHRNHGVNVKSNHSRALKINGYSSMVSAIPASLEVCPSKLPATVSSRPG